MEKLKMKNTKDFLNSKPTLTSKIVNDELIAKYIVKHCNTSVIRFQSKQKKKKKK